MGAPTPRRERGPRSSSTTRSRPKADTGVGYSVSSSTHAESRSIPLVQSRTIGRMEESARSAETVQALLERGDRRRLVDLLTAAHPADVAALLRDLPLEAQVTVFRLLSAQRAGEVLSELDDQTLLQLVQALDQLEVSRILDEMPPDHAAEVVEELPAAQAESLLEMMKEEQSEDVQELLEYPEDTAGRLMSPNAVAVGESATVAEAIEQIRKSAPEGRGFELYVVDDHRHLVGVVPLRRLLTAAPTTPMWAIRDPSVVSVSPETDQEEVARLVAKYDLVAVPVTDKERRLRRRGRYPRRGVARHGVLRPRGGRLDVHLGQPLGGGGHRHPDGVQEPRLRPRADGGPLRDGASGRARGHHLPRAGDGAPSLPRVSA